MDSMKRQKYVTLEDEPPRSEGVQYATGEEQRAVTNSSRKNEEAGSIYAKLSASLNRYLPICLEC